MKIKFPQYAKSFWGSVIIIIVISILIFIANNFSLLASRQILEEAIQNSEKVSEDLYDIQTEINTCVRILNSFIQDPSILDDKEELNILQNEMVFVLNELVEGQDSVSGYFFKIDTKDSDTEYEILFDKEKNKSSHISTLLEHSVVLQLNQSFKNDSSSMWMTVYNAFSNSTFLTYIVPIYKDAQYLGFMGVMIDMEYLNQIVLQEDFGGSKYKKILLLTEDKEILVHSENDTAQSLERFYDSQYVELFDNKDKQGYIKVGNEGKGWVCAYYTLPSGQIFVEEIYPQGSMKALNLFIALITVFSILSMWIVQRDERTGNSAFDKIAEIMIVRENESSTVMGMNRKKAVVALGIGASGVFLSYSIYFFILGKGIYYSVFYFIMGLGALLSAKLNIKWYKSKIFSYILVYGLGFCPILLHIAKGGLGSENTGVTLSWILIIILLSQFTLKGKEAKNALNIFFLMLFAVVFIELYFLRNFNYERLFIFMTSLIFVGFAIFVAVRVYIKGAIDDYDKIGKLLDEVRESQIQLVQREKMVALGQLIAGVAHEINTPIGAVKASAQTMETTFVTISRLMYRCAQEFDDVDYDCFFGILRMSTAGIKEMKSTIEIRKAKQDIKKYFEEIDLPYRNEILDKVIRFEITDIDTIKQNIALFRNSDICEILDIASVISSFTVGIQTILMATARVSKIVFALKSYAYVDGRDEKKPFDVIRNIEDVLVLYHNQIKQSIEVVRDYDENVPDILGKQDEIYQVWANLIQNAIYAMSDGGTLTISVKHTQDQYVKIGIRDTGTGIEEEVMERVFEPFFTTKPLGEGSGMGLDISRKVIYNHDGSIEVQSEKGKGTIFTVKIPVSISHQYKDMPEEEMK